MYDKAALIVCVLLLMCSNIFFMLKALDYKRKYLSNADFWALHRGKLK